MPEAWQSARFAHLIVQFQMEIVLAKLEYEDTGFSPTMIERVNSKKNSMKLKVNLINVMGGGGGGGGGGVNEQILYEDFLDANYL